MRYTSAGVTRRNWFYWFSPESAADSIIGPLARSAPFAHMRYICTEYKQTNMAASEDSEAELPTDSFEVHGHEVMEKEAKPVGNGAHVMAPKAWLGDRVKIVRVTKSDDGA